MKQLFIASALVLGAAGAAQAGSIESACLKADRAAATRTLCSCIEDVAKPMFSFSEERKIAKFFAEPHLTQELRQSDSRSDEAFWDQYKAFGVAARAHCR